MNQITIGDIIRLIEKPSGKWPFPTARDIAIVRELERCESEARFRAILTKKN